MNVSVNSRFRTRSITGVERFATEVVDRLQKRDGISLEEIVPEIPLSGFKGHWWEQWNLPRKVRRDSVLFSPCNTGPLSVKRQLVVIHDAAVWDCPEAFSRQFGTLYRQLLPRLAKRVGSVATVSEFSRGRLAHHLGISEEKIHVLGNATGNEFVPAVDCGTSSPPTLLCVGSLDPRKNFNRLVEAWIQLAESNRLPENARLEIIGSAKPTNFSNFEMKDAPGISWLGRVSDEALVKHYQNATAFIFPSLYEGFGLPPLEAMACGCPVLLSNQASLPEVGGDEFNGKSGNESQGAAFYFDPLSVSEIADSMASIFEADKPLLSQMSKNALAHAESFSWERVADRTLEAMSTS